MSKTAKLPSTENDVKKLIADWFTMLDGFSVPITTNGMGVHGIPDRIGVIPVVITQAMVGQRIGLAVAVEAKKPGRRGEKLAGATQAQLDILKSWLFAGGVGALVDCEPDLDRVEIAINELTRGPNLQSWPGLLGDLLAIRANGGDK